MFRSRVNSFFPHGSVQRLIRREEVRGLNGKSDEKSELNKVNDNNVLQISVVISSTLRNTLSFYV